jgi:2,3-bisphosphoglycerate-independent phosphoglycerate mutase
MNTHVEPNASICLLILDGWGIAPESATGNAIAQAYTPTMDALINTAPVTSLQAHGEAVGMPQSVVGNSEVGHRTLGLGKATPHPRVQLDAWIESGELANQPAWVNALAHVKKHRSTLHLVTLLSTGGVHSHVSHLAEFIGLAKDAGVEALRVHGITDGRDMPPFTAMGLVEDVDGALYDLDYSQIATLTGRFYAMDRDERWQRTAQAFDAMVHAKGKRQFMASQAVKFALADDISDEFVIPSICDLDYQGMEHGDAVLFLNFRPDRMRQLVSALVEPEFDAFDRGVLPQQLYVATAVSYGSLPDVHVFCEATPATDTLPKAIAKAGLKQFHIAETEKYAHVTYFFNGGNEAPEPGEDRVLIPSPRGVETYDEAPAMAVYEVAKGLIEAMATGQYRFYVANFANVDMVAHTGTLPATVEAVQHVDKALGLVLEAARRLGVTLLVTSDHGNGECMLTAEGTPNTAHTLNQVPLILCMPRPSLNIGESTPSYTPLENLPLPVREAFHQAEGLADVRPLVQALLLSSRTLVG